MRIPKGNTNTSIFPDSKLNLEDTFVLLEIRTKQTGKGHKAYLRMTKRSGLLKERKIQLEGGLSRFTRIAELVHKGRSHILNGGNVFINFPSVWILGS